MIEIRSKEYVKVQTELLKQRVSELKDKGIHPKIVIILCGDDEASASYARTKTRFADKIGVANELISCPSNTTTEELLAVIQQYNEDETVQGIMIEMPYQNKLTYKKLILRLI